MKLFILAVCLVLSVVSCKRDRVWVEPDKRSAEESQLLSEEINGRRLVLFAPGAMDLIKDVYELAPRGYANQVMNWLKIGGLSTSTEMLYAPSLPVSNDAQWGTSVVAAASGANLVVLISLEQLEEVDGLNGPGGNRKNLKATVKMRLIDATGKEIWSKTNVGEAEKKDSPKFRTGSRSSAGLAVWNANRKNATALKNWFDAKSDSETFNKKDAPIADVQPDTGKTVTMRIESTPSGADVLIDGAFKGNTPLDLALPVKELELRIERSGFEPWQRRLVPDVNLQIKPSLQAK